MSDRLSSRQDRDSSPGTPPPPHAYPLKVRDAGLATAWLLLMRTLPYALARFAALLAIAALCLAWLAVAPGGAWWISNHASVTFGLAWLIPWLVAGGWIWVTVLRYALHLIACGHVAVVTQLITHGTLGRDGESQFTFGRRIIMSRFGEVTALFGLNLVIGGVLATFHETLDWFGTILPIPGVRAITTFVDMVVGAAVRYLDKVVLSYSLACSDSNAWLSARDGIVYYCQNAAAILKTSVWIVVVEGVISALLVLALLVPAAAITALIPSDLREIEGAIMLGIALLVGAAIRSAFIKPLFLIVLIVRFHLLIENQLPNRQWTSRLDQISEQFRSLATFGGA